MIDDVYAGLLTKPSDIRGHLARLHDLVLELDARQVIELGVRTGRSTVAFLTALDRTDGRLWSCDVNDPGVYAETAEHPRWTFVRGDDLAVVDQAPRPADLVFIDTSHEYRHTLAELRAYAPLVRPGGAVALHDTNDEWPDAQRAIFDWVYVQDVKPRLEVHDHDNGLTVLWL